MPAVRSRGSRGQFHRATPEVRFEGVLAWVYRSYIADRAHHVKILPVRIRSRHELLGVDAVRVVGYRAECDCGWRSPVKASVRGARDSFDRSTHPPHPDDTNTSTSRAAVTPTTTP